MTSFDPADATVKDVKAFVANHPDTVEAVLAAETEGKNRSTLIAWLEEQPVVDPAQVEAEQAPPGHPPWPLPDDRHYFFTKVTSPLGHHGATAQERAAIQVIQQAVGAVPDGVYGPKTASAVEAWRAFHGRERGGYVDEATWNALGTGG
jgi:peptidoglycan hydrolase-like protein with peptidoglycan-binding domain